MIGMTLVNASTPYSYLAWKDQQVMLTSHAGGKYTGKDFAGKSYELVLKGKAATFTLPGQKPLNCKVTTPG